MLVQEERAQGDVSPVQILLDLAGSYALAWISLAIRRRLYAAPSMCPASWFTARPRYRVLRKLPTVLSQPKTSSTRLRMRWLIS